jgi:outer membrane murein-binding lipoprotein Lpp
MAIAIVLALAAPATAAAPPQVVKLRKQVAALNTKVKKLTIARNAALRRVAALNTQVAGLNTQVDGLDKQVTALNAQVDALKAQLVPKPTGSVKVENGENGDHAKVTGAGVNAAGDVLGQIEYTGGLTCESYGPILSVEATFFDPAGQVLETGIYVGSDTAVAGARYPLKITGAAGAVRAEAIVTVACF